ncbi:MAG: peptidase, partial [Hyphomonadaceae bacterium]|nr:peptidase [Hyphomonadaceae bacterium]
MTSRSRLSALGLFLVLAAAPALLSGCGGGGGGGGGSSSGGAVSPPPVSPPPPGGTGPVWTQGSFAPAANFKNRCETPRTGVDLEGRAFPDLAGTTLQEKFWLRSWTNETYLWNREVVDRDPASFGSRTDYFAVLKTTALTPSGKEKDDFHFSEPTVDVQRRNLSAPTATYGARLAALSSSRPRDYRVLYTEPNSPASQVVGGVTQLVRGTRILAVNVIDLVNGGSKQAELDALNQGLF